MRDGDIYFWRFREDANFSHGLYHCKSRKAVVINGRLIDTFWSTATDGYVVDPSICILEFKGNKADLRKINHWESEYYDDADVVDMRHSNSMRDEIFVKASARRSRDAMLRHIASLTDDQESAIRSAQYRMQMLNDAKLKVESGELDDVCI